MGLVPNIEFMRSKLTKYFLVLKLLYTKSGVGLLKIGFLA